MYIYIYMYINTIIYNYKHITILFSWSAIVLPWHSIQRQHCGITAPPREGWHFEHFDNTEESQLSHCINFRKHPFVPLKKKSKRIPDAPCMDYVSTFITNKDQFSTYSSTMEHMGIATAPQNPAMSYPCQVTKLLIASQVALAISSHHMFITSLAIFFEGSMVQPWLQEGHHHCPMIWRAELWAIQPTSRQTQINTGRPMVGCISHDRSPWYSYYG